MCCSGYPILECCKRADSKASSKPLIRQFIYLLESRQAPVQAFLDLFKLSLTKRLGRAVDTKLGAKKQRSNLEQLDIALRYEAKKGRLEVPFEVRWMIWGSILDLWMVAAVCTWNGLCR